MIKKIIVGIDGSEESLHAYRSACVLQKILNASVYVLYIVDQRRSELPYMYSTTFFDLSYEKIYIPPDQELLSFYKKLRTDMRKFGENCLAAVKDMECSGSVQPVTAVVEGIPFETLLEQAEGESMVLLGQHGENKSFHKNILGSTVEEVIRKSSVPVMVCSKPVTKIENVACFDDGSPSYERIETFIASNFSGNGITVTRFSEGGGAMPEEVEHTSRRRLVKNESELLEAVERNAFDIFLIGAHGKHKITEYLLGSHAVHLVRKSSCPIIIVK